MHFAYQPRVASFIVDHTLDRVAIEAAIELESDAHERQDSYQVRVPDWILECKGLRTGAVGITRISEEEEPADA